VPHVPTDPERHPSTSQLPANHTHTHRHPHHFVATPDASAIMRALSSAALLLMSATLAAADDLVTKGRIKVQLFAAPAFVSEVSVDAYNDQCLSLDNNL
jgi:hypothetical protein